MWPIDNCVRKYKINGMVRYRPVIEVPLISTRVGFWQRVVSYLFNILNLEGAAPTLSWGCRHQIPPKRYTVAQHRIPQYVYFSTSDLGTILCYMQLWNSKVRRTQMQLWTICKVHVVFCQSLCTVIHYNGHQMQLLYTIVLHGTVTVN